MTSQIEVILTPEEVAALAADHPLSPLLDALQANFGSYLRLFAGLPGAQIHQSDGATWFINMHAPPASFMLHTRLEESSAGAQVNAILAQVQQQASFLVWPIYRADTPANLGDLLTAAGCGAGQARWMLADLAATPAVSWPDGLQVVQVRDPEMLAAWTDASGRGFECGPKAVRIYRDAYARCLSAADPRVLQHVGFWRGQPVTSSTLVLADGIAGVYDISTPPEFRRCGFGAAITYANLEAARERGFGHACLMSSDMGESVYARLGFSTRVSFSEYTWRKT